MRLLRKLGREEKQNTVSEVADVEVNEREVETERWIIESRNSQTQRWWRKGEEWR